jgi:hypothetical protein
MHQSCIKAVWPLMFQQRALIGHINSSKLLVFDAILALCCLQHLLICSRLQHDITIYLMQHGHRLIVLRMSLAISSQIIAMLCMVTGPLQTNYRIC